MPLLGFSIGAAFALRIASRLSDEAGPLFLLSAAGPLDLPSAFDGMGGGARVFRLAQASSAGFDMLVHLQAMLARRSPNMLKRLLFAGADSLDRGFATDIERQRHLSAILSRGLANRGAGYRRDLLTYVADWSAELARITAPVEMWHGHADTWAPITMADGIASRLPTPPRLHIGKEGHYTTLIESAHTALDAARKAAD